MTNAISFDTLAYAKRLIKVGVPEKQAEVQAETLADLIKDQVVTKQYLDLRLKELEMRLSIRLGGMMVAGICAREKVLNDGRPVAVYLRGIFDMVCSGAVKLGGKLQAGAANNWVHQSPSNAAALSGMAYVGTSLATGADAETIQVLVNAGCVS